MRLMLAPLVILAAPGCATLNTLPFTTVDVSCAATILPADPRIAAWSVDKFTGRYLNGAQSLTLRRDDQRLLVERTGARARMLQALGGIESWQWSDACGANYSFSLPPDGPGALLTIREPNGATSEWHRP